ncbi:MAG: hypothetical protein DJ555_02795 [Desulfurococcaceae archaeon]|jgi:putative membrane protein|nr:MAG: hypothetical protein DJ555_02795 [Desulfurococcaceae archaeon]
MVRKMPILFVDPLDLWLMLLGASLIVAAYGIYVNAIRYRVHHNPQGVSEALKEAVAPEIVQINKGIGLYFTFVGIYALVSGLWGGFTWPLPGSNNIVLIQPWAVFGVASLIIGLALWSGIHPRYIAIPLAPLGIPVIVYSFAIWIFRMTRTPEISGLMYFLIGLSVALAPAILSRSGHSRIIGWVAIALLAVAAFIALYIGINAAFGHIAGWRAWTPWYGAVNVTAG